MPNSLTKTELMNFCQCEKRLWLRKHKPDLEDDNQADKLMIEQGNLVGRIAREQFPGGVLIDASGRGDALADTAKHIGTGTPLFEAAFESVGGFVRVDILDCDTLIEVKSGTRCKDHYVFDAAIQACVANNAGHRVNKVQLALVNSDFTLERENDYTGLIRLEDVTGDAMTLQNTIALAIEKAAEVAADATEPDIAMGSHCNAPHPCPYQAYCGIGKPEYPVETLPRGRGIAEELRDEGIEAIADIPEGRLSNARQERVRRVVASGEAEMDDELVEMVRALPYPRYYLDFETISFAVPIWVGTKPYQALPFQWSCHIEAADGEITHTEFLDISGENPTRKFNEALIAEMGERGPIIVYSSYEKRILRAMREMYPDLADALTALIDRLVDLLPPMRRHFYHPAQHGSWSIKAILPIAAPDLNYGDLEGVHDGAEAQAAYVEAIDPATDNAKRKTLEKNMLAYCALDTLAMVRLINFLR